MGRKIAASTPEEFALAIAYLKRAMEKRGGELFVKPGRAGTDLAHLENLLSKANADGAPALFSSWVSSRLTGPGRVRLLNALRRRRADAKPDRRTRRTISVAPSVYGELERLSKSTGGVPMPKLLESLAAIANVDKNLQAQIFKLSVALGRS